MADQPYQFGDVVDGHRWTITGWEPVEAPERTVGVPRLLEKRYAATQEAQARRQASQTQTLDQAPPVVVQESPEVAVERDHPVDEPTPTAANPEQELSHVAVSEPVAPLLEATGSEAYSLEELLGGGRTVVAAPDLAIEFDDHADPAQQDVPPLEHLGTEAVVGVEEVSDEVSEPDAYDARPPGMRAWYGLGLEPVVDPEPEPSVFSPPPIDDDDAPFAAALALGTRALAEQYQPSEIEIAAGVASGAVRAPEPTWNGPEWEPIDEWNAETVSVPAPEPIDAPDLTYGSMSLPEPSVPDTAPEPEPAPSVPSEPPAAGWYPGSA